MATGLLGHEKVLNELKALADRKKLGQGYVLFGPPRIGKQLVARIFAQYLEYESMPDETKKQKILIDMLPVNPTGNSIGIDEVRKIKTFLVQKPAMSAYRTVIINDADRLTDEAQNAFLKISEEPPSSALLLFIVRDPESLWPTLRSRVSKLYCAPIPEKIIEKWLIAEHTISRAIAHKTARESFGAPGLAHALLFDEGYQAARTVARQFLEQPVTLRTAYIKDLIAGDTFDFDGFLEHLLFIAYEEKRKNVVFLGKILELRVKANYYNLNPRIQLMALASYLKQ